MAIGFLATVLRIKLFNLILHSGLISGKHVATYGKYGVVAVVDVE